MSGSSRVRPGPAIVLGFMLIIAIGAILLMLPLSHKANVEPVSASDAVFTAASAVTVTGLATLDTATTWSPFGLGVILVLIEIGGIGVMTLAGYVGIAFRSKVGLRSGLTAAAEIGLSDHSALRLLLTDLLKFVLSCQAVFASILTIRFWLQDDFSGFEALGLGVFHSISAFNNAGFSTFEGGLIQYVSDPIVNLAIMIALAIGGLGFPVVFELRNSWRNPSSWSLHTKVTLKVSAALVMIGSFVIAILEWNNPRTLGALDGPDRLLAATFQAATARTAGFSTVEIGDMYAASWLVLILYMVIGTGSASTGGGIKVTTLAVVAKAALAELRGDATTTLFQRRIPIALQRQALALMVVSVGCVGTATFLLAATNRGIELSGLLFEAASAFGTVGISTGATTELNLVGQVIIMALMFIGRVGPITFGTAMLLRSEPKKYRFANESLIVG